MNRLTECRAAADYTLWLRFDDGLEGSISLESLVEIGSFRAWRNVAAFTSARADEHGCAYWPANDVRLDHEILYQELLARGGRRRTRAPARREPAFERFMAKVLEGGRPGRRRRRS